MNQNISIYSIVDILGEGGMGKVYLASDPNGNQVAIKELRGEYILDKHLRERFKQEVKILSKLDYPSIVKMLGYFEESDNLYLVMEYVQGVTLEKYVLQNTNKILTENEAISILNKILDAINYAHSLGIVHRDIKPSNIIINNDRVTVLDFGIAKDMNSSGLTVGMMIMGTDGYISPEQASGYNIDRRTDIYSLGCVLYFMLTGKAPFNQKSNDQEMRMTIIREAIPNAKDINHMVSDKIQQVIDVSTNKNMLIRYQTCNEFKAAIAGGETNIIKNKNIITIGREKGCDIEVYDSLNKVSRVHAEVEIAIIDNKKYYIFRDRSSNGTLIGNNLVRNNEIRIPTDNNTILPKILLASSILVSWDEIILHLSKSVTKPEPDQISHKPPFVSARNPNDVLGFGYGILAFLIPIAGVILYLNWKDQTPIRAKNALILSVVSFIAGLIISFNS